MFNCSPSVLHTCLTFYFSSPSFPAVDGSLRIERSKTNGSRGSGVVAPKKPARCLETLQPQEIKYTAFIKESIKAISDVLIQPVDSKRRRVTVPSGQRDADTQINQGVLENLICPSLSSQSKVILGCVAPEFHRPIKIKQLIRSPSDATAWC